MSPYSVSANGLKFLQSTILMKMSANGQILTYINLTSILVLNDTEKFETSRNLKLANPIVLQKQTPFREVNNVRKFARTNTIMHFLLIYPQLPVISLSMSQVVIISKIRYKLHIKGLDFAMRDS